MRRLKRRREDANLSTQEARVARLTLGILMNGVTGRMGTNQHLARSIMAIREEGGTAMRDGTLIWPEPILVGRSREKLEALAAQFGLPRWSTDLDACLEDPGVQIYF